MCFMERATLTTAAVEEWRPIEGWEGLYEVSNMGRVRSLDRYQIRSTPRTMDFYQHYFGRILKPRINKKGYHVVMLQLHKNFKRCLVSRLVAKAFIPNPDNLPVVNHKDQNPHNNCADNLEWCTVQYNCTYNNAAFERGKKRILFPIEQLTLDGHHVAYFNSMQEADRILGYYHSNIGRVIYGKRKQYRGYLWRKVDK